MKKNLFPLLGLTAALVPFLILATLDHPQNDDYVYAVRAEAMGFLRANLFWFNVWSGRYTTTALLSVNPLVFGSFFLYKCVPFATLVLLGYALAAFLREVTDRMLDRATTAIIALSIMALYLAAMPEIVQNIYMIAGDACYQLGHITVLAVAALLLRLETGKPARSGLASLVLCGLIVAAIGTNELSMLILDEILVIAFLLSWRKRRRVPVRNLVSLAVALCASIVVLASPGNRARYAFTAQHDIGAAVQGSLAEGGKYLWHWLWSSPLLFFAILAIVALPPLVKRRPSMTIHPLIVLVLSAVNYFALFFPSFYGTGSIETRTVSFIFFCLLLFLFLTIYFAVIHLKFNAGAALFSPRRIITIPLVAVIAVMLLLPGSNLRSAYADILSGTAVRYDRELRERYEMIRQCPWIVCEVPPLTAVPKTIYYFENALDEKQDDPFYFGYKDGGLAAFFGKRRVRLSSPATYDRGR